MNTKQIYDYIERLGNLLRTGSRHDLAEYGLQPIHLEVLHYLSLCNRYSDTPMGVTDYLGQTKGTVSQTLKVLEKKRLLSKHPDSNDKRITHLKISSAGKKLIDEIIPSSLFIHACEQLTERSQTQTIKALKELLQAIQYANSMKSFGVCHTCRYNQKNENNGYFCELTQESLSSDDIQLICREHQNIT
ncbi:MAG: MarR family winged helix-turn-helix transcriptional regulator [Gammaproteobacteria bacterium]|nr:MarR family winged helix-turn-helix transcriptional regulator [Gammaproteobacteria bacterium]